MITSSKNKVKFSKMLNRHEIKQTYQFKNGVKVVTFKDTWSMNMIDIPCGDTAIMTGKHAKHTFDIARRYVDIEQSKLEDF
jgi:hypothetical protein